MLGSFPSPIFNTSIGGCCCVTSSIFIFLLALFIAGALALMMYCVIEILQTNEKRPPILMSTSEVYSLNEYGDHHNTSVFTSKVCIDRINKMVSNSKVYLEHGKCADLSKEEKHRKIEHSFSDIVDPNEATTLEELFHPIEPYLQLINILPILCHTHSPSVKRRIGKDYFIYSVFSSFFL